MHWKKGEKSTHLRRLAQAFIAQKCDNYQNIRLKNFKILKYNSQNEMVLSLKYINGMVNILKFCTLVTCQKGLDKQGRPRSDCL